MPMPFKPYAKFTAKDDQAPKGKASKPGIVADSPRAGLLKGRGKKKKKKAKASE